MKPIVSIILNDEIPNIFFLILRKREGYLFIIDIVWRA